MICHTVTSVTYNNDYGTQGKEVEGSGRSDVIQHVHYMLTSCLTHGGLG